MKEGIMRTVSRTIAVLAVIGFCMISLEAMAQAPNTITYQGKLTDDSGRPITVATDVIFAIYSGSTGGTPLYTTTLSITPDINGIFTVALGPIAASVFDGSARYLGITVGSDAEMTPRQLLASTPYSFNANNVPGIGSDYGSPSYISLTATDINLATVTVNVPAAGYVVVIGSAYYVPTHVSGTKDLGRFSISRSSQALDYSYLANVSTPANATTDSDMPMPVCLHRVDAVSAGSVTYYFVADAYTGSPRVNKARLAVMFFPIAYGAVGASPISADLQGPYEGSAGTGDSGNPEGRD